MPRPHTKPYTALGIKRVPCFRCGAKASRQQWQICADGNRWRALCNACDVALNQLVLEFMGVPEVPVKIEVYKAKLELTYGAP